MQLGITARTPPLTPDEVCSRCRGLKNTGISWTNYIATQVCWVLRPLEGANLYHHFDMMLCPISANLEVKGRTIYKLQI